MTKEEGIFLSFATTLAILNSLTQTDSKTQDPETKLRIFEYQYNKENYIKKIRIFLYVSIWILIYYSQEVNLNDYQWILQFLFFTKNVSVRVLQNLRYYSDSRENELGYSFVFYYIVLHDRLLSTKNIRGFQKGKNFTCKLGLLILIFYLKCQL